MTEWHFGSRPGCHPAKDACRRYSTCNQSKSINSCTCFQRRSSLALCNDLPVSRIRGASRDTRMAPWYHVQAVVVASSAFAGQKLTAASSLSHPQSSNQVQQHAIFEAVWGLIDGLCYGLQRWVLRMIAGELGAWDMVKLVALCGLTIVLGAGMRKQGRVDSPVKRSKNVDDRARPGSMTSQGSVSGEYVVGSSVLNTSRFDLLLAISKHCVIS